MSSIRPLAVALSVALLTTASDSRAQEGPDDAPALLPDTFQLNDPDRFVSIRLRAELGALSVVNHTIRYGDGTQVDYRRDADQDTLFPFQRLAAEIGLGRNSIVFLYQPLGLFTESVIDRTLTIGDGVFTEGTLTRFGYGFDIYRISYQYDFFAGPRRELAIGAGLQIRNARVLFASADGTQGFTQTNLGPVPTLRFRWRQTFDSALFLETELEGIFTPVPGEADGRQARGALLDGAIRTGFQVTRSSEIFLNLRYLGGGYRGPANGVPGLADDDETSNWLHTVILSLGFGLR